MQNSDIQSQQLPVDLSFSARVVKDTVDFIKRDLRNLTNPDLRSYYPVNPGLTAEQRSDFKTSSAQFRTENGLVPVSNAKFDEQITAPRPADQFREYLGYIGIETRFQDDLTEDVAVTDNPYRDDRSAFIYSEQEKDVQTTTPEVLSELSSDPTLSEQIFVSIRTRHLVEPAQPAIADDVIPISENINKAFDYARQYLR